MRRPRMVRQLARHLTKAVNKEDDTLLLTGPEAWRRELHLLRPDVPRWMLDRAIDEAITALRDEAFARLDTAGAAPRHRIAGPGESA